MTQVALIGFGEAGQAFAGAAGWTAAGAVFDVKTNRDDTRAAKLADYARCGVGPALTLAEALAGATVTLSLVTADQAEAAAEAAVPHLGRGSLYLDMNSVSPATKRRAAAHVEAAGAAYVDVAIMAPVLPQRLAVPLRAAGPHAGTAIEALAAIGFTAARTGGSRVGDAAAVKLLRSVIVKGAEALTAEAFLGAEAAGLTAELVEALGEDWRTRAPYNLERMAAHGERRAAEMEEAALMLEEFGVEPLMTYGTITRQRARGRATQHDAAVGAPQPFALAAE